jgi:hypothetical protein
MHETWGPLVDLVSAQVAGAEIWQTAELHLLERAFADRLAEAGITPTPEAAATLMAAATFLVEHTPEWGGDARDALGELAALGLRLLERCDEG